MAADSGMYRTGPIVFATIRPSGAMTNVSGTPVTPKSIAVADPGSSTRGHRTPEARAKLSAADASSSNETPTKVTP